MAAYRPNHTCTVPRDTPKRRATEVTVAPASTSSTARYRSSETRRSHNVPAPFQSLRTTKEPAETTRSQPRAGQDPARLSGRYRNCVAQEPQPRPGTVRHLPEPNGHACTGTAHLVICRKCAPACAQG